MSSNRLISERSPMTIILVEDDRGEAKAICRAFDRAGIAIQILHVRHGEEALDLLRAKNARPPSNFVMLVDINMPIMNGIELIAELRRDPLLHKVVVFVLTTSTDERDVNAAHDLNVAGYVSKEDVGTEFRELISLLSGYWRLVELPDISIAAGT